MKHFKLLGVTAATVFTLSITPMTAFALPDVSLTLAGSSFPLHVEGTLLTVATRLSNSSGSLLSGEGVLALGLTSQLSSLGTFETLFTKVGNSEGTKCNSVTGGTKDPAGEILTKGTYHLVYTSLAGSAQGLQLGILYLVAAVEIVCGALETIVRGNILSSLSAGSSETAELTEAGGQLLGNGKGKNALTNYYNDAGTGVAPLLQANAGAGFVSAAEEIITSLGLGKALKTNMFVITSR